jgi:hypothetical protein
MRCWRVVALVSFAWLSSCIGGYEPDAEIKLTLGIAIVFSAILDWLEPFEKEKL